MPFPLIAAAGLAASAAAPSVIKQVGMRLSGQAVAGAVGALVGGKPANSNLQPQQFSQYQHPDGIV